MGVFIKNTMGFSIVPTKLESLIGDLYGHYVGPSKDQACQVPLHCPDLQRFGGTNSHQTTRSYGFIHFNKKMETLNRII